MGRCAFIIEHWIVPALYLLFPNSVTPDFIHVNLSNTATLLILEDTASKSPQSLKDQQQNRWLDTHGGLREE